MHVVVLGIGMIGTTVVRELVNYPEISKITVVDGMKRNIESCINTVGDSKVTGKYANLLTEEDIIDQIKGADVAVACLPHSLSLPAIRAAIAARCNLVDLVGSKYDEKIKLHNKAKEAGIIVVPGCGVAPGLTNFLAAQGIEMLDEAEEAVMVCGGIPRYPVPPLWYQVVFRLESVMGLYTRPALAVENGKVVHLPALSGLENMTFSHPVGECESVITDAHSTAYTLKDKVNKIYEKTVRYAGHWTKMSTLAELGFLDEKQIEVEGLQISPRKFTEKVLESKLVGKSKEDITVLRVTASGKKNGNSMTHIWEMIDFYDHEREITSMAKTTAIPAMLLAHWILTDKITETGVVAIENIIKGERFGLFMSELKMKGIEISYSKQIG